MKTTLITNTLVFLIVQGTTKAEVSIEINNHDLGTCKISFHEKNPDFETNKVGYKTTTLLPMVKEACNYAAEYGIIVAEEEFEIVSFTQVK